jgi:hypothetical protein
MSTTQIFVELLIIGIGVIIWIVLFIAGIAELPFSAINDIIREIKLPLGLPLMASAYVFGILLDRVVYSLFNQRKHKIQAEVFNNSDEPPVNIIEKIVLDSSEELSKMVHYNRSRMRICRSWFVNFLLIGLTFLVWQSRIGASTLCLILVSIAFFTFAAISFALGEMLEKDHFHNLRWSYDYIRKYKNQNE